MDNIFMVDGDAFRWEVYMYKHLGPRWFENVFDRNEWREKVEKVKEVVTRPFRLR